MHLEHEKRKPAIWGGGSSRIRAGLIQGSGKEEPWRYAFPGMLFEQATELVVERENSIGILKRHGDAEVLLIIHDERLYVLRLVLHNEFL